MNENEMRITITIPREAFGDISPEVLAKLFASASAGHGVAPANDSPLSSEERPTTKEPVKSLKRHKS